MTRILILIILIWALYLIIKYTKRSIDSKSKAQSEEKPEQKLDEKIVQCAHCGCHVPETESQLKNNKITCNNPECQILANKENQHGD